MVKNILNYSLAILVSLFSLQIKASTTFVWDENNNDVNYTKIFAGEIMVENLSQDNPRVTVDLTKDDFNFWPNFKSIEGGYGEKYFHMLEMNKTYSLLFVGSKEHYEVIVSKMEINPKESVNYNQTRTTFLWDENNNDVNYTKIFAGENMVENLSQVNPRVTVDLTKDDFNFWPNFKSIEGGYGKKSFHMLEMNKTYKVSFVGNKEDYTIKFTEGAF